MLRASLSGANNFYLMKFSSIKEISDRIKDTKEKKERILKLIKEFDDIEDWLESGTTQKDATTKGLLEKLHQQRREAFHTFENLKKIEFDAEKELKKIKNK